MIEFQDGRYVMVEWRHPVTHCFMFREMTKWERFKHSIALWFQRG